MRLPLRAHLTVAGLMLAFLAALGIVGIDILRSSVHEEVEAASKVAAHTLTAVARRDGSDLGRFQQFLQGLGRVRAHEVMLYDRAGKALYQSPPSSYKKDRYAPAWFARLVDPRPPRVSIPLPAGTLVLVPDTTRSVVDAWDDACRLLWVVVGFFGAVGVLVHWLVGRALRPMDQLLAGLNEMERGNFAARLPAFRLPELARVSHTFNRMAGSLASSIEENRRLAQDSEVAALVRLRLEEERKSVARELHDELGQCITAIKTIAVSISNRTENSPEIHGSAQAIATVAGTMYDATHGIVSRLRLSGPEGDGAGPLRELVSTWQARHPDVSVDLCVNDDLEDTGEEVALAVFRLVQECLTNVARHAAARHVAIHVERSGGRLDLRVRDDGRGLDAAAAVTPRFGLLGMRERVHALRGEFRIDSEPGQGVCVSASLPLRREQEEEAQCA